MKPLFPFRKTCLAIGVIQALLISPNFAATLVVDSVGESDSACSLRNALESINTLENVGGCNAVGEFGDNDVVTFAVSQVSGLETELLISNDVSINPSGSRVVISANPNTNNRVLAIRNSSVEIENVTITGGRAGLIDGGGIVARDCQLSLVDVDLIDNTTDGDGGGLYLSDSEGFITNSRISNNSADDGGGINSRDSNLTITNSVISSNRTESSRTGGDDGGGIFATRGFVSITNSTISDNNSEDDGGGIHATQSTLTLSNITVSGNNAGGTGGGINIFFQSNASMIHSTVSNNDSESPFGGAISVSGSTLDLSNSLVVGNRATGSSFLAVSEIRESAAGGVINFLGRNLVGDDSNTLAQAVARPTGAPALPSSVILATSDSSQAASLASIINPLDFNDGATPTHALVEGSPAIDAATNGFCESSSVNNRDQRNLVRTEFCDIGAFEFGATEAVIDSGAIPPILFLLLKGDDEN